MSMRFVLTLHSHLPWVLHHGRWPHGSDWLCEAALDSYLPLIAALDDLEKSGTPSPMTIGITPILAAQFAHPSFNHEMGIYFAHRLEAISEAPASLVATGDAHLLPLVDFWRAHFGKLHATWQRIGGDLIGAFRRHMQAGRIELISSAATHGFLPLLGRDESIRLQLLVGRAEHLRHFGELPRGCWVPECAYRPRGPWQPLPSARAQPDRPGIEEQLRFAGLRWFFVDAHMIEAGEAFDMYFGRPKHSRERDLHRSAYRPYRVGTEAKGRPVEVLVRDSTASAQIWSRHGGYPGDGRYLEFHKIRQPGGLKLWRVTGSHADLGAKEPYVRDEAESAAAQHAKHFSSLLRALNAAALAGDRAIAAPFDTELFGHWWFEGPTFLELLFRDLEGGTVAPATAGAVVGRDPATTALQLQPGSWGADGDFSMWLNPETEWTWERLWPLEERFWNAVPGAMERIDILDIVEQAARELLLAQSSDWQFIISTGAAGDYATKRFNEHCDALEQLLPALENPRGNAEWAHSHAAGLAAIDGPFPDIIGAIAAASDVTPA